jgi:hypothetical protein
MEIYSNLGGSSGRAEEDVGGWIACADGRRTTVSALGCVKIQVKRALHSVERQNLTMRMHMRRFARLTNAFSKKVENHAYAVALHMMYYNFVRIRKTLRVTPAMAAGVSDGLWEIADIAKLVEDAEAAPWARGPYKKQAAA